MALEYYHNYMRALKGEEITETDAQAYTYLYTVGLTALMDHD